MFCGLSGTIPEEPVVCTKSGHVYERRLIEQHIATTGREPVTGEEVSASDLLAIKANKVVKPRPAAATSIPGMLSALQAEWDACMLETFSLRQQLETTRQELSQALYQHDAACRVIARLARERDSARAALTAAQAAIAARGGVIAPASGGAGASASSEGDAVMAGSSSSGSSEASAPVVVGAPLAEAPLTSIKDKHKELSRGRRKRGVIAGTAAPEALASLKQVSQFTPHSASQPGITVIALPPVHEVDPQTVITGGADGMVQIFDAAAGRVLARCGDSSASSGVGSSKQRVTGVVVNASRDALVSANADGVVTVWAPSGAGPVIPSVLANGGGAPAYTCSPSYAPAVTMRPHGGSAITSLSPHPIADWVATTGKDGTACLLDTAAGRTLAACGLGAEASTPLSFTTGAVHPDGLLLTAGCSDGVVRLWDLRENSLAAELAGGGHASGSAVRSLCFSENGYLLASGGVDACVKLWDLRKPDASLRTFTIPSAASIGAAPAAEHIPAPTGSDAAAVTSLAFDWSGQCLAAGGADGSLAVWGTKEWASVWFAGKGRGPAMGDAVTGVQWGALATRLYATSMDRTLRVFA